MMEHSAGPQATRTADLSPPSGSPSSEVDSQILGERLGLRSGPVKILLVDDDPETARGLSRSLMGLGHRVTTHQTGQEALVALQDHDFDVVLSDIGMPEMNGFDLLDAIRRLDGQIPIVLLTGDPTVSTAARALEVGAFRYVTKPVEIAKLTAVVEKAANMHRMAVAKAQAALLLGQRAELGIDHEGLNRSFDRCLDQLWIAFQPIVDVPNKTIFGYEGLMRSREPDLPHPGAVLDAAERLSRVTDLGRKVRRLIAYEIPAAPENTAFFVNLHVRDLLDDQLLNETAPLAAHAHRVVLEVTERASLAEVPDVKHRISTLREQGFRIAVDDLGAGYAGLTSFALLEPEIVKLDMSLVRDIHLSRTKSKVVRSMIDLAQDMGMLVVGEGIETKEEAEALIALNCNFLQGFYYARPAPPFVGVPF